MGPTQTERVELLVLADSAHFSGAESVIVDIVRGLAGRQRFALTVASPVENPKLRELLHDAAPDARHIDVPAQSTSLAGIRIFDPRTVRAIRSSLSGTSPDAILLNLPSPEYGAGLLVADPFPDVPIVGFLHTTPAMRTLGFKAARLRESLARRALRRLDRVLVLSDAASSEIIDRWDGRELDPTVVRLPVPEVTVGDQSEARRMLGLPDEATLVGIVGRVTTKQKGHDILIEASRRLAGDHPDLRFVVAGEGKDLSEVRRRIGSAGLTDRWVFLGQVSPVDVFFSAIDLIAIPSRFEGLPLVALEALQAGVPGIATDVDGLGEVWPPEWVVPAGDPVAFAERMEDLLRSDDRRRAESIERGLLQLDRRTTHDPSADVASALSAVIPN